MAKKHGFRGTPVRPNPRPGTMGRVFESKGLGTSVRDQEKFARSVGRNLETENPDMDRYFARLATDLLKPAQIDRTNEGKKRNALLEGRKGYDPQRRAAQNMLETRRKVREAQQRAIVFKDNRPKRPDDGVKPDNIPETKRARLTEKRWEGFETSREEQTPNPVRGTKGTYDFSGKLPPKEIKKHGKIYRRK